LGVVEDSKRMYGQFLDAEDIAKVEAMDEPDQAYFWTRLWYELPSHLSKSLLHDMESDVINRRAILRTAIRIANPEPLGLLSEAWDAIKPHAWFKTVVG